MPKRTYKLLRFDGGINNDADPRDIGDNQFSVLENVAVDEMGKIVVLGDIQTTQSHSQTLNPAGAITSTGTGLFACTTDHTGLLDFEANGTHTPGQTYYLVEDSSGVIGKGSTDESGDINCSGNSMIMYYVDGALRIAESDLTSAHVTPIWRGFIEAKTYMPGASGDLSAAADITEGWVTANAEIAGCFPEIDEDDGTGEFAGVCKNALMLNIKYCHPDEGLFTPIGEDKAFSFDGIGEVTTYDYDYNGQCSRGTSDHQWGCALEFFEEDTGTGTWQPELDVKYKFWITTMYDEHTQESLPQLLRMWNTEEIYNNQSFHASTITKELHFRNGDSISAADVGENVAVRMKLSFKIHQGYGGLYNFGASDVGHEGGVGEEGNKRISGVRYYWSSNEDAYTTLWQMFDCKFDEGVKVIGADSGGGVTSGYTPWNNPTSFQHGGNYHATAGGTAYSKWTNPPRYFQYDVLNAHSPTDVIKVDSYKTAVVANRRVYLGNIKQDGKIHGDRMLKSPVNQFDKFPSINNIDVAIHDGDDIVALVEYADRILQFKKNTCYIINVSGNTEYLEAEHKFKGITNPGAVCRTDYGAAWVNRNGCYMYDGQQVTDLLEDGGMRKINQAIWSIFIGTDNYHRIGFNPFKRQLIVLQGTSGNDAYVYDMVTKSWTYSTNMIADGNTNSNFINDPVDGSLLIFDDSGKTIDKWADDPLGDATPPITIITKDIDFGEPSVRKKVYKAYISYKSGSTCSAVVTYGINGDTTPTDAPSSGGSFSTSQSAWTIQEVVFGSGANSCKSIQLKITGDVDNDFAINDISIIYRTKGIK